MSVETTRLESLGRELGEAIAETPEYRTFEEKRAAVQDDDEVQELIANFEQMREKFMLARQSDTATQADLRSVQRAQQELHEKPEMAAFLDAQAELQSRLKAVNEAVSEPLVVDFGGEAGGCCHD